MTTNRTWICLFAALAAVGCAEEDRPVSSPERPSQEEVETTTGGGGSSEGGSDGGVEEAGGAEPVEAACAVDSAFRATGMSFAEPTHPDLADEMNEIAYGYDAAPITIVLRPGDGTSPAMVGASASEENDAFMHQFVLTPELVPATVWDGGFRSDAPQASAVLRLADTDDIALENVQIDAKTTADCGQLWVVLDAVISASAGDIEIGGDRSIEQLAGDSDGGWQLRAIFLAESVSFDFGSP